MDWIGRLFIRDMTPTWFAKFVNLMIWAAFLFGLIHFIVKYW